MRSTHAHRFTAAFVVCLSLAFTACRENKITTYTAPKDPAAPATPAMPMQPGAALPEGHPPIAANNPTPAGAMPSGAMPAAPIPANAPLGRSADGPLSWTAPADWVAKPVSSMRIGSYDLPASAEATAAASKPADLSISLLGPAMGVGEGLLSNINRWRGQVQLGPITSAELAAQSNTVSVENLSFVVVDFTAPGTNTTEQPATRILAAILATPSATYFFKITGNDLVVARHKVAFLDFLKTVRTR